MNRRLVPVLLSLALSGQLAPACFAASQPDLNFKIYSPQDASPQPPADSGALTPKTDDAAAGTAEKPVEDKAADDKSASDSLWSNDSNSNSSDSGASTSSTTPAETSSTTPTETSTDAAGGDSSSAKSADGAETKQGKVLKGYIRVVPSGTKVPIIMDTAVDSDTSQEGDEFAARTSEDLNIDGTTVVPAGSVIKGRIAQLNAPRNLGRSGSVALKFDTVTTPDNRQIPLVANLVARGGVVHARRGLKDIAMDTGTFALPTALGLGIGLLAGNSTSSSGSSKSHLGKGAGAVIGAGVGAAVGIAILAIKKGKKVDVRPGDELKIELAEDLRMPM